MTSYLLVPRTFSGFLEKKENRKSKLSTLPHRVGDIKRSIAHCNSQFSIFDGTPLLAVVSGFRRHCNEETVISGTI